MVERREKAWIMAWAALSGAALLALHNWIDTLTPEAVRFEIIWPLYFLAIFIPLGMQMMSAHRKRPLLWLLALGFAVTMVAIASHLGYQSWTSALDLPQSGYSIHLGNAISAVTCCWMLLMPFAKHRLVHQRWSTDYEFFFASHSSDVIKLVISGFFVPLFWFFLCVWALIFKSLGIIFFAELFFQKNFVYPATTLAFGVGLCICSVKEGALTNFYRKSLSVVGWLLPLFALIAVLFLLSIPFTDLPEFWKSKVLTPFMFNLLFVFGVLLNAACQDYRKSLPLPAWLLRIVSLGILTMPVYCALCAYAIGLKVSQHGWSVGRIWAALNLLMLATYWVGYAVVCLRKEKVWMQGAKKVNIVSILAGCLLCLLAATPLLDPGRLSVDNQVARLMTGKVAPEQFDFSYLRFKTGRYGNEKLHELTLLREHPQAEVIRALAGDAIEKKRPVKRRPMAPF